MGSSHEDAAIAQTQSEPTFMIINDRSVAGFDKSLQQTRKTYAYLHRSCHVICSFKSAYETNTKNTTHVFTPLLRK